MQGLLGYQRSVRDYDRQLEIMQKNQCLEADRQEYGGIYQKEHGLIPQNCAIESHLPMVMYCCRDSKFYRDASVLQMADRMLEHLERNLNEDGTVNYYLCNMHSAPDTAFVVLNMAREMKLLLVQNFQDEQEVRLVERLGRLLKRMGDGILAGGFHTPNHRWVISAALSLLNSISPNPEYEKRINLFLDEGIDCNEDGEYTERSAGNYHEINNRALLILVQELGKTELLEYVGRNLYLMPAFFYPDFSIFTENSSRQDKGGRFYGDKYAYQYLLCGYLRKDEGLQAIGRAILENSMQQDRLFPVSPEFYMLFPEIFENLPEAAGTELFAVNRIFYQSGILRMTKGKLCLWMLENQPDFLFGACGNVRFSLRGHAHFFNCRHIMLSNMRATQEGYAAEFTGSGRYYLPLGKDRPATVWAEIGQENRECTPELNIHVNVALEQTGNGVALKLTGSGCENALIRFELDLNPGILVRGEGFMLPSCPDGDLFMKAGILELTDGEDWVSVGPFFGNTEVSKTLPGSAQAPGNKFRIHFQHMIPFEKTIYFQEK